MMSPLSFCVVGFCILVLRTCATKDVSVNDRWEDPTSAGIYLFGTELMQAVANDSGTNENIFVSPLSAYIALSMLHLAAEDQTRAKLNEVLKIPQSNIDVSNFHANLGARLQQFRNQPDPDFLEILISNGFFMDKIFPVRDQYIQLLRQYYGNNATVTPLNFDENVSATKTINSWISNSTKNRINEFFGSPLSKTTRAILTSAIYFKGIWNKRFNESMTTMQNFTNNEGGVAEVQMMSAKNWVQHYRDDNLKFTSIELPYEDRRYAMMIILPDPSQNIRDLSQQIHLLNFKEYAQKVKGIGVEYKIPKMNITSTKSILEALHLEDALNALKLSVMTSSDQDINIQDVRQAAEIEVNENGTIATAVTEDNIGFKMAAVSEPDEVFVVDRPFMFFIVQKSTYTLLFSGIVNGWPGPSPSSSGGETGSFLLIATILILLLVLTFVFVFYLRYKRRRDDASYR